MADTVTVERVTFSGGEIGPALRARADLSRYQIAVETMENYLVMVEGGATRRPGTKFVLELRDQTEHGRLVPFRLAANDHYMIVINDGFARFMRDGGFLGGPYELAVPWVAADLPNLRFAPRGNTVIGATPGKRLYSLNRVSLLSWTVTEFPLNNGPFDPQNLATTITIAATGVTGLVSLIASSAIFNAAHVGSTWKLEDSHLEAVAQWKAGETGLAATNQRRYDGNVYAVVSGGTAGTTPPTHLSDDWLDDGGTVWRFTNGPYGLVTIVGFVDSMNVGASVLLQLPQSINTGGGTWRWSPPALSDFSGWPTALAWSGQRMWYFRADRFWASSLLDPQDMLENGEDDRAISGRLLSPDPLGSNVEVVWALDAGVLLVGSSDVEWIFRSTAGVFAGVTAKTLDPKPDSNEGSVSQVPALVDGGAMFAGRSGRRLMYGKIDPDGNGSQRLTVQEASVGAREIFKGGIAAIAWQRDPQRVLWMALTDGTLAGLTWMPKEKMLAFHRHPMVNGFVEDIAVVPSTTSGADDVYLIVRRTINGGTKRYVELLQPTFEPLDLDEPTAEGAWFVDCGLRLVSGSPVTVISGLGHLEGQEVAVFADGAKQARRTVASGAITIAKAARNVLVGLPIRAEITDLPRNVATQAGPTTGQKKFANQVNVHLMHCGGGEVGTRPLDPDVTLPLEKIFETGAKAYKTPVKLFSGLKVMTVECETAEEVRVTLVNDDPMPCTVLGLSPRLGIEEGD